MSSKQFIVSVYCFCFIRCTGHYLISRYFLKNILSKIRSTISSIEHLLLVYQNIKVNSNKTGGVFFMGRMYSTEAAFSSPALLGLIIQKNLITGIEMDYSGNANEWFYFWLANFAWPDASCKSNFDYTLHSTLWQDYLSAVR